MLVGTLKCNIFHSTKLIKENPLPVIAYQMWWQEKINPTW